MLQLHYIKKGGIMTDKNVPTDTKIIKTKTMRMIEILLGVPLEEFLKTEYVTYHLDVRQISEKVFKLTAERISYVTIARWLKKCNIKTRKQCWE